MIQLSRSTSESFKVVREVVGPYQTNCYLIYGTRSGEAALIDPGCNWYSTGNILFSGDMLFRRSVGNLDLLTSNTEAFIKSVRGLYRLLPDSTIVYPGHNQPTDIGSEEKENQRISLTGGLMAWWHLH